MPTPTHTHSFALAPKFLKALLLFASKDETRYVLNGVAIQSTGNRVLLVATDGRRLAVINITDEVTWSDGDGIPFTTIIPRETILAMPRPPARSSEIVLDIGESEIRFTGRTAISSAPITANYPNWQEVIPTAAATPMQSLNVNHGLLNDFVTCAKILGGDQCCRVTQHGGDNFPLLIRIANPNFLGVLMPTRNDYATALPEWLSKKAA